MTITTKSLTLLLLVSIASFSAGDELSADREAFRDAYTLARSGHAQVLKIYQSRLSDYALWPDLVSASYLGRISKTSDAAITAHLQRYPETSLNRTLRYRYLKRLAQRGAWAPYLSLYEAHYATAGDTELDCHAARARLATRDERGDESAALDLWLVGKSQPKACDPLFHILEQRGRLTRDRYDERLHLALARGQLKLARFLARHASADEARWLERWQRMRKDPESELPRLAMLRASDTRQRLYAHGLKRLARRDAAEADRILDSTHKRLKLDNALLGELREYVALRAARQALPAAGDWIARLDAPDDDVHEWGVRAVLREGDWTAVLARIERMPAELQSEDTWRYWHARALEATGQADVAEAIYAELAGERSYHGFLAADRLERDYTFAHKTLAPDSAVWAELQADPQLVRARELYFVGLYGPARSEWDKAVADLDTDIKRQAGLLADSWGWHASSIKTLARSAGRDDLIRFYPTPYKAEFDETTRQADIERTWAYGITRSESLFMSDVKSSAGAVGLMQLIPGTGRETARRANLPYRGLQTLLDPQSNIRLGVHYLGQMYDRFDDNQVLATAAYNAGPSRVKSWLPEKRSLPADVWIETIPFNETRNYVKRVLLADAIFHWRLTGTERRLAALMPPVTADRPGRVASK